MYAVIKLHRVCPHVVHVKSIVIRSNVVLDLNENFIETYFRDSQRLLLVARAHTSSSHCRLLDQCKCINLQSISTAVILLVLATEWFSLLTTMRVMHIYARPMKQLVFH